jgi:hypothetical protein
MPPLKKDAAAALIKNRHPEWSEHQKRWRFLLDSLEGGERYRHADYFRGPFDPPPSPWYAFGYDNTTGEAYPFAFNQYVERNLIPHLSEMSVQGRDLYALRIARTPVPRLVSLIVRRYLSRIYSRQVVRTGPVPLESWWADTDGRRTPVTKWLRKTVAPLLLSLGNLDLVFGHPETPAGQEVRTRADLKRLGIDTCIAGYILPENMVWWREVGGRYLECLVHERDPDSGGSRWRHWTAEESNAYTADGDPLPAASWVHPFGRVPIVRVFDDRKPRCCMIGDPRMEFAAENQKDVYNRASELILSDVLQCHALLQGPEDYCQADAKISLGPGGLLPMKRLNGGDGYQGFAFVDPPKSGATECRQHIIDAVDSVLLFYGLLKPAGMTEGSTVSQSGVSKQFDAREGNDLLSEVAQTLQELEHTAAEFALGVLLDRVPTEAECDSIEIEYPREFELFTAEDLAGALADIQTIVAASGGLPESEGEVLKRLISVLLPGLDEQRLEELRTEVDETVAGKARDADYAKEARGGSDGDVGEGGSYDGGTQGYGTPAGQNSTEDPSISLPDNAAQEVAYLNTFLAPEIA